MHAATWQVDYVVTYYCVYLGACALLIAALGWTFHRAGGVFLKDAFAGNTTLIDAVARLLDIGFYLVSVGYVALTYSTYLPNMDLSWVLKIVSMKIGGLMLLLGVAHLFNLLLLALFRQRRTTSAAPVAGA
jgi:predicted neutral ceramidase superfamily lipid hydrolase